jgi:hypothetical protein
MRTVLSAAALVGLLLLCACEVRESTAGPAPRREEIRSSDLQNLTLGKTSPQEVEGLFGPPNERKDDGALVYRWATDRGSGSITFQFAGGALSKLCRERS